MTPLMMAACFGHTDIALTLIERGADPDIRNNDGKTVDYYVNDVRITKALRACRGETPDTFFTDLPKPKLPFF